MENRTLYLTPHRGRRELWWSAAFLPIGLLSAAVVGTALLYALRTVPWPTARVLLTLFFAACGYGSGWPGLRLALRARDLRAEGVDFARAIRTVGLPLMPAQAGLSAAASFASREMAPLRVPLVLVAMHAFLGVMAGTATLVAGLTAAG